MNRRAESPASGIWTTHARDGVFKGRATCFADVEKMYRVGGPRAGPEAFRFACEPRQQSAKYRVTHC